MPAFVVVGGFFGDEGKGKIISYIAKKDKPAIAVRGGAGPNAGHTIKEGGTKYKVRMVPSAFLNQETKLLVGPGVVLDPNVLLDEVERFEIQKRTIIDSQCGIIEDKHKCADSQGRLKDSIGSTGSGTGPANADRAMRTLKMAKEEKMLSEYIGDVAETINSGIEKNQKVLVEGTQGTFLSLWHGTYPYVTSKDVTASGICADVGIGPKHVDQILLVFKSYVTRVGTGPLDNELSLEEIEKKGWKEVGTVTGRPRRAAEFDFDLARKAVFLNTATQIALTKLDVVFPECQGVSSYDKLSGQAKSFVEKIEAKLGVTVTIIGTGEEVDDVIDRRE